MKRVAVRDANGRFAKDPKAKTNAERNRAYYERKKNDPEFKARRMEHQRRHKAKYPEAVKAREMVNYMVRHGRIVKPSTCEKCGLGGRIEGHHEDYSKPLEVQWLCVGCHHAA